MSKADNLDEFSFSYRAENVYDFDNKIILNWYPTRIQKTFESFLDLGLGHGYATNLLSYPRHVVLEGSKDVIRNFKKRFPEKAETKGFEISETYFEKFDTEEKFDAICFGFVLEHVENPIELLKKFKKFLKPGGSLFVAVPNAEALNRRIGNLAGLLPSLETLSLNDVDLGHRRFYTVKTLTKDIELAGLRIKRTEGLFLKPLTSNQMMGLKLSKKILDSFCQAGIEYPELCCSIFIETLIE